VLEVNLSAKIIIDVFGARIYSETTKELEVLQKRQLLPESAMLNTKFVSQSS